mmetsp:Transcript_23940/g.41176  ORF Transcript_23940/g.41176 Transcript_23940/m.41176 type:complete len:1081 (+) Transcript_23940:123-3365(+)|eukprot:CAMPEP_0196655254 /NCGR_PEP_ID=MMETSP1086-20130531/5001_1 /TAXON_ID=77921 /ORGANISM="Cyanoptyche  gloeocystis , Strain SAG4.97" /LENGTH=1080 /DNA_ID=CAMNT_0041987465 /DNA_START=121 /DNA_END=3363 /DNA_ORIENTATION=+
MTFGTSSNKPQSSNSNRADNRSETSSLYSKNAASSLPAGVSADIYQRSFLVDSSPTIITPSEERDGAHGGNLGSFLVEEDLSVATTSTPDWDQAFGEEREKRYSFLSKDDELFLGESQDGEDMDNCLSDKDDDIMDSLEAFISLKKEPEEKSDLTHEQLDSLYQSVFPEIQDVLESDCSIIDALKTRARLDGTESLSETSNSGICLSGPVASRQQPQVPDLKGSGFQSHPYEIPDGFLEQPQSDDVHVKTEPKDNGEGLHDEFTSPSSENHDRGAVQPPNLPPELAHLILMRRIQQQQMLHSQFSQRVPPVPFHLRSDPRFIRAYLQHLAALHAANGSAAGPFPSRPMPMAPPPHWHTPPPAAVPPEGPTNPPGFLGLYYYNALLAAAAARGHPLPHNLSNLTNLKQDLPAFHGLQGSPPNFLLNQNQNQNFQSANLDVLSAGHMQDGGSVSHPKGSPEPFSPSDSGHDNSGRNSNVSSEPTTPAGLISSLNLNSNFNLNFHSAPPATRRVSVAQSVPAFASAGPLPDPALDVELPTNRAKRPHGAMVPPKDPSASEKKAAKRRPSLPAAMFSAQRSQAALADPNQRPCGQVPWTSHPPVPQLSQLGQNRLTTSLPTVTGSGPIMTNHVAPPHSAGSNLSAAPSPNVGSRAHPCPPSPCMSASSPSVSEASVSSPSGCNSAAIAACLTVSGIDSPSSEFVTTSSSRPGSAPSLADVKIEASPGSNSAEADKLLSLAVKLDLKTGPGSDSSTSPQNFDAMASSPDSDAAMAYARQMTRSAPNSPTLRGKGGPESDGSSSKPAAPRWTVEENRALLEGLRQFGKGDWVSIAKVYVRSRTAEQIRQHYNALCRNPKTAATMSNFIAGLSGRNSRGGFVGTGPDGTPLNVLRPKVTAGPRWTDDEHRNFLEGLRQVGKDWRKISRFFVPSRTAAQVKSHAQKVAQKEQTLIEKLAFHPSSHLPGGDPLSLSRRNSTAMAEGVSNSLHFGINLGLLSQDSVNLNLHSDQSSLSQLAIQSGFTNLTPLTLPSNSHNSHNHHQLSFTPMDMSPVSPSSCPQALFSSRRTSLPTTPLDHVFERHVTPA